MTTHSHYMNRALELARKAWGCTSPNPMVGCVIVKDGLVVGEGYHHKAGEPHAEVNALADAGGKAQGATAFVTLEPCSSTGRTGPCTEALKKAGISHVVIGSLDPNPSHAGRGVRILEDAGVVVEYGVLESECLALNEGFFKWITTGKPFVILKMAMTLDGKIATEQGDSKWVTGEVARARVQELRRWADAVMVGGGTVRADKPSLTVRDIADWPHQPERIVVSSSLDIASCTAQMGEGKTPIILAPEDGDEWAEKMVELGEKGITTILIEGGGELAAEVLSAGVVDKVEFHIATKILGGRNSRPVVGGLNPLSLAESHQLKDVQTYMLGNDIAVSGYVGDK